MFGNHSWQWPNLRPISIAPLQTRTRCRPQQHHPEVTSDGNGFCYVRARRSETPDSGEKPISPSNSAAVN
jgi:hypothetical protein